MPAAITAVLLAMAACGVSAQEPSAEDRLRSAIAERWGVDAMTLRIEWPSAEAAADFPAAAEFRLLAGGDDGVWYVDVEGVEGGTARLRVRAGTETVSAVAARDLERGVELTADDIALEPSLHWGPPAREASEVEAGWVTRRRIRLGEPLRAPAASAPLAVKPGDAVRLVYTRGAVELVLAGRAAGSGAVGERVAVRVETGKRLEGVIVARGTVRVESGAGARR